MARKTYMAWADTTDPNALDAAEKAVTDTDVPGVELQVPARSTSVALDLQVVAKNATNDLFLTIENSRTKDYWAKFVAFDDMILIADEVQATANTLAIKIPNIVNGLNRHIRLGIQESDYVRFALRGDVAGATAKMTATFFEQDT